MNHIEDLFTLMARDPSLDSSWNQSQALANLAPSIIKKAYEIADTIARQNGDELQDQLGELLFQVLRYAQLAQAQGWFDLTAIITAAKEKIIQHNQQIETNSSLPRKTLKVSDPHQRIGTLTGISRAQPALTRAIKLQKRAAQVGFDWTHIEQVLEKIAEELKEVQAELSGAESLDKLQGEIGDLFFACINLARYTSIDPETAIGHCNDRFEQRFRYIEHALYQRGSSPAEASLGEMQVLWEEAKSKEW